MKYSQSEKSRELQPCELQRKLGREQERHGGEQQVGLAQLQPHRGQPEEESLPHPGQDQLSQEEKPGGAGQLHCSPENWNPGNAQFSHSNGTDTITEQWESSQLKIESNKDFNIPS